MTTPAQASGAGFKEDGVEFYPMTLLSFNKMDVWMQDNARVQAVAFAREEGLRGELLRAYIETRERQAQRLSMSTLEGVDLAGAYAGLLKILEVSSRDKFKPEKLAKKLKCTVEEPSGEFVEAINELVNRIFALTRKPAADSDEDEEDNRQGNEEPDPTK